MLYIAHLSFDPVKDAIKENQRHGHFTIVMEADDVDSAMEKAKSLIQSVHAKGYLFNPEMAIYLDVCVEVKSLPEQGLLTFFSMREHNNADGGGVSAALVDAPRGCAEGFMGEDGTQEPLLIIEEGKKG